MERLSASILGQDNKVDLVNKLIDQGIKQIHYDVMNGTFIPNKHSLPFEQIREIVSNTKKHIVDIHLMITDPDREIQKIKDFADIMTFHYESESIDRMKKLFRNNYNLPIGIAINPKTNVEQIYEFLYEVKHVLVMSVVPGKGGQSFIPETIDKIEKLKKYITDRKLDVKIQVDGGINNITAQEVFKAGADSVVSGSYLVNNLSKATIKSLK